MIEWLRSASADPQIEIGERILPIAVRRHPTARRMILRLKPDGSEIRVTVPRWGKTSEAVEFARSRTEWLEGQLAKTAEASAAHSDGKIRYRGRELEIEWEESWPRKPVLHEHSVAVGGPEDSALPRLQRWLEAQALAVMAKDLAHYCERAGIAPVPAIRLSRAKRRWGSCSSKGTVRINWRLIQAPDAVRRSVVAHEVAHLTHFDHSPAFYALLGEIFDDDLPAADGWLKAHGRGLYAAFG